MTRIVIADDHRIVREGLKLLLEQEEDFSVIGEAADGLEAVEMVERSAPDVLVLDIALPSMNGIEVAEKVKQDHPETKIVILSMYANEAYFLGALRNNVDSYVLKNEGAAILVQAVREVMDGRRFLSALLTERTIDAYLKANDKDSDASNDYSKLTQRERDVVRMIAEGHTNASIASHMSISQRTVETHRANVMHKLGLTCQADLVRFAVRSGMLE